MDDEGGFGTKTDRSRVHRDSIKIVEDTTTNNTLNVLVRVEVIDGTAIGIKDRLESGKT